VKPIVEAGVKLGRVLRSAIVVQEELSEACGNLHEFAWRGLRRDSRSRETHLCGMNLPMPATESCEAKNSQRSSEELWRQEPEPPEE